ncbi:YidB family protein [Methylobacterium komagatae]
MTALLGLLAVAGFQNKDEIAQMLSGASRPGSSPGSASQSAGGFGVILGKLGGALAGGGTGGLFGGGLGQLVDRFRQNGYGEVAAS